MTVSDESNPPVKPEVLDATAPVPSPDGQAADGERRRAGHAARPS